MAKYLLIVNPISSRRRDPRAVERMEKFIRDHGAKVQTVTTSKGGDARRAARAASGFDAAIVCGGDGTIAEVVDGLAGRDVPLAVVPSGAGNILAKELGIPADPLRAIEIALAGRRARMDAGVARSKGLGGRRRFLMVAGAGFDARVVHEAHRGRKEKFGQSHFILPAVGLLVKDEPAPIKVVADGERFECMHAIIANVASYGGPFRPAPDARWDDGLFDLVLFLHGGAGSIARYAATMLSGARGGKDDILRLRARRVSLKSKAEVPVHLDGDPAGTLPMDFEVEPGAVSVIVP